MPEIRIFCAASVLLAALALACASQTGTIGAVLGQRGDGRLFVRDVPPLLGAAKSGLRPGDEILLVDGKDVRMLDEAALRRDLEGDVGSAVKLTIVRGDAVLRVTVTRTPAVGAGAARAPK